MRFLGTELFPRSKPMVSGNQRLSRRIRNWRCKRFVIWVPYTPITLSFSDPEVIRLWSADLWRAAQVPSIPGPVMREAMRACGFELVDE